MIAAADTTFIDHVLQDVNWGEIATRLRLEDTTLPPDVDLIWPVEFGDLELEGTGASTWNPRDALRSLGESEDGETEAPFWRTLGATWSVIRYKDQVRPKRSFSTTGEIVDVITLDQAVDPWMNEVSAAIAAHRNLNAGWSGNDTPPPDGESLDAAELISRAFLGAPMTRRPIFAVSSEGKPSFATYTDDLYFHLTVESPRVVSWYAVKNGHEYFSDDIEFDGDRIPEGLLALFTSYA